MKKYLKNLNRVEFVITNDCTGNCIHCSQGEHKNSGIYLDGNVCEKVLSDISKKYNIHSVMTFGGEPLIYPKSVYAIQLAAKNMGIPKRQLITNGYFSKDKSKIKKVAQMMYDCGINDLLLSVDSFHQQTIPIQPVMEFAKCIKDLGMNIRLNPSWLVDKDNDNEYNTKTKQIVCEFKEQGIDEGVGNTVFPEGNAKIYLDKFFDKQKTYTNPYEENPNNLTSISINSDGSIFDGNIYDESIIEILERYDAETEI